MGVTSSKTQRSLEERAVLAAETALANQQYVSAVDVLLGMGLLQPAHLEAWRKGQAPCLEAVVQAGLGKASRAMASFTNWARERGLRPSETAYLARMRGPRRELPFSVSGNPEIEKAYRTHWVSPALSGKQTEKLREKLSQPAKLVVFSILRDSACTLCATELPKDSLLFMEAGRPLCLACADLDHLTYLESGDAALTRRATKYSRLSAVVVRFSRARKRYERQGILVEEEALEKAEQQCISDEPQRARRREQNALARREEDEALVERMTEAIRRMFPACPAQEARRIAAHTALRGSGRVGRTEAGRALDEDALRTAVLAAVRHRHTKYDELIMRGLERRLAREEVREHIEEILRSWEIAP